MRHALEFLEREVVDVHAGLKVNLDFRGLACRILQNHEDGIRMDVAIDCDSCNSERHLLFPGFDLLLAYPKLECDETRKVAW